MEFTKKVHSLLEEALTEQPDLFLIDLQVYEQSRIRVTLDGDNGVSLQKCMAVSRHIEHNLDREKQDFSLEVSSAGASSPLQNARQYRKHIGRKLLVETADHQSYKATLTAANDDHITLDWKAREPKPVGKGKHTVTKQVCLSYDTIQKATVQLQFK
ncbi:MAG: ribosome assembly cofactor RimP [Flavobacteriaceae bacterium]|jgi:ribosome maturation factor RimP